MSDERKEPPACLPDFFATEPSPRSWCNVLLTLMGLALAGALIALDIAEWSQVSTVSDTSLESSLGVSEDIMIRCNAAFGCRVEEKYTSAECGVSADENVVAMERGETATFRMCASEGWEDGVFVKVRLGVSTEILRSPVEFLTGKDNQPIGFPRVPLLTNLANVGKKTAAPVTMGLTLVEDHTNNYFGGLVDKDPLSVTSHWDVAFAGDPASGTPCDGSAFPSSDNFLCYQLLLKPTITKISQKRPFTIFGMLEAWGGAFGLVFGIIGMATFWIEECLACRPQPASRNTLGNGIELSKA